MQSSNKLLELFFPNFLRQKAAPLEKRKSDPLEVLPQEIAFEILSNLDPISLASALLVSKRWNVLSNDELLWKQLFSRLSYFGAKEWMEHFGVDVGEDLPLTMKIIKKIFKSIESNSPFFKGLKGKETLVIFLVPNTVNEDLLTLEIFGRVMNSKYPQFGAHQKLVGYRYITEAAASCGNDEKRSYLAMMTLGCVEGSNEQSYSNQEELIATKGKGKYQITSALCAVIGASIVYVQSDGQKLLFGEKEPVNYARCKDEDNTANSFSNFTYIAVGSFNSCGLIAGSRYNQALGNIGAAAVRKFLI